MPYTYLHRRSDTGAVFYIGKGSHPGRANCRTLRSAWWKSIVAKAGGRTVQILAHWPTEADACEHEKFLIACFRDLGAPLCNMTDGGEGASGRVNAPDVLRRMSEAALARGPEQGRKTSVALKGRPKTAAHRAKLRGRTVSPETRARMSAAKKGHPLPAEHAAKIAAANIGRRHSEETKARMSESAKARWARS